MRYAKPETKLKFKLNLKPKVELKLKRKQQRADAKAELGSANQIKAKLTPASRHLRKLSTAFASQTKTKAKA